MYNKTHRLTFAVGLAEVKEVGVNVVGSDVGTELGVADGCTKICLEDVRKVRLRRYRYNWAKDGVRNQFAVLPSPWVWQRE